MFQLCIQLGEHGAFSRPRIRTEPIQAKLNALTKGLEMLLDETFELDGEEGLLRHGCSPNPINPKSLAKHGQ